MSSASPSDKQRLAAKLLGKDKETEKSTDKTKSKTVEGKSGDKIGVNVVNRANGIVNAANEDELKPASEPAHANGNAKKTTKALGLKAHAGDVGAGTGEESVPAGEHAGADPEAEAEAEVGTEATPRASVDGEQGTGEEAMDGTADDASGLPVSAAEAKEIYRIETGDTIKVKQVLDASILMCVADQCGYELDFSAENWKLVLMFVACCFALTAQFYPLPFPASRPILGVCCAGYFAISGLLQYILSFVDGDCILTSYATSAAAAAAAGAIADGEKRGEKKTPAVQKQQRAAIEVHTSFPRFQEWFTLIIQKKGETDKLKRCVAEMYVGKYFTEAGDYDEDRFTEDVRAHVRRFEDGAGAEAGARAGAGEAGLKKWVWVYDHKTKND